MIISEKQIMQLIAIVESYQKELILDSNINPENRMAIEAYNEISYLLGTIYNQQPKELNVIE